MEQKHFQILLAQKYSKQFHIVDIPSLSFSLAQQSSKNQINQMYGLNSLNQSNKQSKKEKQKSKVRQFYENLKFKLTDALTCIYRCLQKKQLAFSQFFQYEQLVLGGFLRGFVDQIKIQCRQKGDFLQFIWSSTIRLMHSIFQCYERRDFMHQSTKTQEVYQAHKKYNDFMEKQALKIKQQSSEIKGLKQIIQIFIQKLRIRKKQVKKLLKETSHLMVIVNQFKDKNIELQMKYLALIQSKINSSQLNQQQGKQITLKKQRLNAVYNQILTIENSLNKHSKVFQHQVNIEGPLEIDQFIKVAAGMFQNSEISNDEVKAQFQTLFDKVQQDFEDIMFKLNNKNRHKTLKLELPQLVLINKQIRQQAKKIQKLSKVTQTTYTDKLNNSAIKNMGISVNLDGRKYVVYKNTCTQYDSQQALLHFKQKYCIHRTVDIRVSGIVGKENQRPIRISLMTGLNFLEARNKIIKQEENKDETSSIVSNQNQENKLHVQFISKKKKNGKQQIPNIKSRFSTIKKSPKKTVKKQNSNNSSMKQNKQNIKIKNLNQKKIIQNMQQTPNKIEYKQSRRSLSAVYQPPSTATGIKITRNKPLKQSENVGNNILSEYQKKSLNQHKIVFQQQKIISNIPISVKRRMHSSISRFSKLNGLNNLNIKTDLQQKTQSNQLKQQYEKIGRKENKYDTDQVKRFVYGFDKQQMKNKQKQNQGIIDNLIKGTIALQIKKQNIKVNAEQSVKKYMQKIIQDVRVCKVHEYGFQSKKMLFPIKHNNLMSIIGSVYARSYNRIQTNKVLTSFADPLYQSILVLYGSMEKSEIYKKMINFIAQISCQKYDHICKSFIYFLAMDEEDQSCQNVTSFDNYLYLKLINKLSNSQNPLSDITQATTDYLILQQKLANFLEEENISRNISNRILSQIKSILYQQMKLNEKTISKKLNLFFCCKIIVKQIIQMKQVIRDGFYKFYNILTKQKDYLQEEQIQSIVRQLQKNKIQQVKLYKKVQQLHQKVSKTMNLGELSSVMLRISIHNFEQYYVKVLTKFDITSAQRKSSMVSNKKIWKNYNYDEQKQKIPITQQIEDILMLNSIQNVTNCTLEEVIGKQIGMLYSISILIHSQI